MTKRRSPRYWVKLHRRWVESLSHRELPWTVLGFGALLLIEADRDPDWKTAKAARVLRPNGRPHTIETISLVSKESRATVRRIVDALIEVGTLVEVDGTFVFPNYREYQETRQAKAMRDKRTAAAEEVDDAVTVTAEVTHPLRNNDAPSDADVPLELSPTSASVEAVAHALETFDKFLSPQRSPEDQISEQPQAQLPTPEDQISGPPSKASRPVVTQPASRAAARKRPPRLVEPAFVEQVFAMLRETLIALGMSGEVDLDKQKRDHIERCTLVRKATLEDWQHVFDVLEARVLVQRSAFLHSLATTPERLLRWLRDRAHWHELRDIQPADVLPPPGARSNKAPSQVIRHKPRPVADEKPKPAQQELAPEPQTKKVAEAVDLDDYESYVTGLVGTR